jgi:hypothetical protein
MISIFFVPELYALGTLHAFMAALKSQHLGVVEKGVVKNDELR